MLIAKSRKSDRKSDRKGDKKQRERARKRAALLRRVLFSVLIVGVLGVFLYNNRDYFFDMVAEQKPKPEKPKSAKEAKADRSGKESVGGRSVDEVLGGLEFPGDSGAKGRRLAARPEPAPPKEAGPARVRRPDLALAPEPAREELREDPPKELPKDQPKEPPKELVREDPPKELPKDPPKELPREPPKELARPDSSEGSVGSEADSAGGGKGLLARLGADRIKGKGSELLEKSGVGGIKDKGAGLFDSWVAGARAWWDGAWAWVRALPGRAGSWARTPVDRVDSWARPQLDSARLRSFLERADSLVLRGMGYTGGGAERGAVLDTGDAEVASDGMERGIVGTNIASVVDGRRAAAAERAALRAVPSKPLSSLSLPDISCSLRDRSDLRINMSLELLYDDDAALRGELDFKRGTLLVVAGAVVRGYEYGNVNMSELSEGLLNSFNGQLKSGQLSGVDITEFQVEQITSGYWKM